MICYSKDKNVNYAKLKSYFKSYLECVSKNFYKTVRGNITHTGNSSF